MQETKLQKAIHHVKEYFLRAVDEEAQSDDANAEQRIKELRELARDIKTSDRFIEIDSTRNILELHVSVMSSKHIESFIHMGATYLVMCMTENEFNQLVVELHRALTVGHRTSMHAQSSETGSKVHESYASILLANPWLVFIVIARFAWFNQPSEKGDAT